MLQEVPMAITVRIPTPLRRLTNNQETVTGDGANLAELMENLGSQYPGLVERICDEDGKLRRFINIYVNDEDVRFLQGKETPLKDGDEVSILPAIAGG